MLDLESDYAKNDATATISKSQAASTTLTKSAPAEYSAMPILVSSHPEPASTRQEPTGTGPLTIALIGPNEHLRHQVSQALAACNLPKHREYYSYPPGLDDLPRLIEQQYDVILIDLDSDPEYALAMVERLAASGTCTVMVYSAKADSEMLLRCMRAGAREFLQLPLNPTMVGEAMAHASVRRPALAPQKRVAGKLFTFMGSKGGAGVTTLACNFAVAVAVESGKEALLIDLDLPLGDAALNLGLSAEFSVVDALQASTRLDSSFLASLLVKHSSGLSVLAAPGRFLQFASSPEAVDRLMAVARQSFDIVIVDLGSRLEFPESSLLRESTTIYLVTQTGIPDLRNSNRLILQYFQPGGPKVEVVLSRYEARAMGVTDDHIEKALTRAADWKIPNDFAAVRRMQVDAVPLIELNAPIARTIRKMAVAAAGTTAPVPQKKKKGFGFFG